ncbi:MAG: hypothetical protein JWN52_3851 [Actinomycetia bacterium]|nr:hypothetical protein [Actinomycetes bacterium]
MVVVPPHATCSQRRTISWVRCAGLIDGELMIRKNRSRVAVAAAVAAVAAAGMPVASAAAPAPALTLVAASPSVTLDRWGKDPAVFLNLGTYLTAGKTPFEVRATRKSYADPIVAKQIIRQGGRTTERVLPKGLLKDFSGFPDFLHLTITDNTGKKVVDRKDAFCPNSPAGRVSPSAPATSSYPEDCPANPFARGTVWGIQAGWGANALTYNSRPVVLADGTYTIKVSVTAKYRSLFRIPAGEKTVNATVVTHQAPPGGPMGRKRPLGTALKPNAAPPAGRASVPKGPKPDLRPLPAWGIGIARPVPGGPQRDYLQFSANVWNGGTSPLVVDGFRRPGKDLMDAYQYFYDAKGKQVGYAPTGGMEWDPRDGHQHWHFKDFASYRLLNGGQKEIVRSQKEAFCLADTDAIDYTLANANWKPYNTNLRTACGDHGALSVREVLDVGSGDTYMQYLPGQSFDITDLPNGTYYIQVIANPVHKLYETNTKNNVSLRKVILGGHAGARTVKVPPYQLIDAP